MFSPKSLCGARANPAAHLAALCMCCMPACCALAPQSIQRLAVPTTPLSPPPVPPPPLKHHVLCPCLQWYVLLRQHYLTMGDSVAPWLGHSPLKELEASSMTGSSKLGADTACADGSSNGGGRGASMLGAVPDGGVELSTLPPGTATGLQRVPTRKGRLENEMMLQPSRIASVSLLLTLLTLHIPLARACPRNCACLSVQVQAGASPAYERLMRLNASSCCMALVSTAGPQFTATPSLPSLP